MTALISVAVVIVTTPTVAGAAPPSRTPTIYAIAYSSFRLGDWGTVGIQASRDYNSLGTGQSTIDAGAHASLTIGDGGYGCTVERNEYGYSYLPSIDDFTIDFQSLQAAHLAQTSFVCSDPDATQITAELEWIGDGRMFLLRHNDSGLERAREFAYASGTVTVGTSTFTVAPTPASIGSVDWRIQP